MVKRIFSKKSGFTLVEIVVAVAIFAIMVPMVLSILNLMISERRENQAFADKLAEQEEILAKDGKDKQAYDESKAVSKGISLAFDGMSDPILIDYEKKAANGADDGVGDGLIYFINKDSKLKKTSTLGSISADSSDKNTTVYVAGEVDARITGTKGLRQVSVNNVEKDYPTADTVRYKIECGAASGKKADGTGGVNEDDKEYSQFRLYFYTNTLDSAASSKKYSYDDKGTTKYYTKDVYEAAPILAFQKVSGNYAVDKYATNAIRVGVIPGSSNNELKAGDRTVFYVTFPKNKDPQLTKESFGKPGNGGIYEQSPRYDIKTGQPTGEYYNNIYGSMPYVTHPAKAS